MGLLDENNFNTPAQKCPRCKDGVVIKDRYDNISCTSCPLSISKGGFVRGWSLRKTVNDAKRVHRD